MIPVSLHPLLHGGLMIDAFALLFPMHHLFWISTAGHMSKASTVNGWHVKSPPFEGIVRNLLRSHGPFATLPCKASLISWLIPQPTITLIVTTLMTSRVHIPFETTYGSSFALDVVILGTGQDHVLRSIQANPHIPLSQDGRIINSFQSRPGSRSVSHTMSAHPVVTRTTLCTANTSVPSARTPNTWPLVAPGTDLADILYKIVTPYILAAWSQALSDANLIKSYPNLVHDLSFGSPIGNLPCIEFTFIPDNLPSAKI